MGRMIKNSKGTKTYLIEVLCTKRNIKTARIIKNDVKWIETGIPDEMQLSNCFPPAGSTLRSAGLGLVLPLPATLLLGHIQLVIQLVIVAAIDSGLPAFLNHIRVREMLAEADEGALVTRVVPGDLNDPAQASQA